MMVSSFDYQSIAVPLLKSFMRVCVLSSGAVLLNVVPCHLRI